MATVITRSIASTPKRTATETWDKIASILAPKAESIGRAELQKVAGVAASSIASEAPQNDAFVVHGNGPQVRIYCIYGEGAVSGDGVNEDPLKEPAVEGDWRMSMPAPSEDVTWTQRKL